MTLRDLLAAMIGFGAGALICYLHGISIVHNLAKDKFVREFEKALDELERQGKIVRVAQR